MRKFSVIILVFCYSSVYSQSCLPEGITFETQTQIDSFQIYYPGCTEIEGSVTIKSWPPSGSIVDLIGLNVLTSIGGSLVIQYNDSLTDLSGLDNINHIGGMLELECNDALGNISVFSNLYSIEESLWIRSNYSLTSLTGLDNITSIGGDLFIDDNNILSDLTGLGNLDTIVGNVIIGFFSTMTHSCFGNDSLLSLSGLDRLKYVGGDLKIYCNHELIGLGALLNLNTIGGNLKIGYDEFANNSLQNLSGLDSLIFVGGISIEGNIALTSLSGLDGLTSIEGDVWITYNPVLSDCDVESICAYLASPNGETVIESNAPGCNSPEEVQDSCEANAVYVDEQYIKENLILYPNPASQKLNISAEGLTIYDVAIHTLTGQQVFAIRPENEAIDISILQPGMYIVEVTVENRKMRKKLLVK